VSWARRWRGKNKQGQEQREGKQTSAERMKKIKKMKDLNRDLKFNQVLKPYFKMHTIK
jgi:hypothetical protein